MMGSSSKNVRISQEGFDALVMENIHDLGMDPAEALADAIETLKLQGVDLSGILKCVPGISNAKENPVVLALDALRDMTVKAPHLDEFVPDVAHNASIDIERVGDALDTLWGLCSADGSENVSIARNNGGLEVLISICSGLPRHVPEERALVLSLKTLAVLVNDIQCAETFKRSDGPKVVMGILNEFDHNINILNSGFAVVAAAASGNEILKEAFMELNIDELLVQLIVAQNGSNIQSLFDALRVLLTPDDTRVLASQVFGYARRFAKIGMARVLVDALCHRLDQSSLVSASLSLRAVAVNEEICRMIAENSGIDVVLQCISDTGMQNNKAAAIALCSLLSKLAASDANKSAIVEKQGLNTLIQLSSIFAADPAVLQEIMSIICVVSLRSPENAASAMEAGAGDLAVEAMLRFPTASQLQRQACLMIRNLVVRNPENRDIFLNNGVEKIIRLAKDNYEICKHAASDALRDLGLENYND
ncbi:uncharacterized protein LOC116261710 [Nymphaea colorata]|nr:uncharacterized protein LOC116261710 [Nymphaea colorata]